MYKNQKVIAIVTAGGKGLRMGTDIPKQFLLIGGKTILERSIESFWVPGLIEQIIVTYPKGYDEETEAAVSEAVAAGFCGVAAASGVAAEASGIPGTAIPIDLVEGGSSRQESVYNALKSISPDPNDIILVHDGARPFCPREVIERVVQAAEDSGAAICGVPSTDTIRHIEDGTLDRDKLVRVQTPQGFRASIITEAYRSAMESGPLGTDDAGLVEKLGCKVSVVQGSEANIKITGKGDLPVTNRIGTGYDVHAFADNRKLILCGVEIPFDRGLDGHSDADVATHALMDALLGAAALPDIGRLFPDTDDRYKGASSMALLGQVMDLLKSKGYRVSNVDVTIICQKPKLAEYIEVMRGNLAECLSVSPDRVGLKATTTEKLGFVGREEGIAAEAVCLITDSNFY